MAELVDITPDVSLLAKVGRSGHSVAEAVAELVDNALDARIEPGSVTVVVDYDASAGSLTVSDDGAGMSRQELADALVLGLSQKGQRKIGHFGLGLKTACTSLGTRFSIVSARPDAHYAYIADYDQDRFLESRRWVLPIKRKVKPIDHGTIISVESSRLYVGLAASLRRNLSWTFRHFLTDGLLELHVNGQEIRPAGYEIQPESLLPIEGQIAERRVHGWVGLLEKSSQRGSYGFALVRHRRIVRRHQRLGFQPHPSTARVVGELHLDDFETNNLKTDFIRETEAWRELEEWLSETIEPVVSASRALAHAGMLDLKIKAHLEAERARLLGDTDAGDTHRPAVEQGVGLPVAIAVGALHLQHVFERVDPSAPYLNLRRISRKGESDLLEVRTNLDHPAASTVANRSGFACHNIAEAAALELGPEDLVATKSVILSKLLAETRLRRALSESARGLEADQPSDLTSRTSAGT